MPAEQKKQFLLDAAFFGLLGLLALLAFRLLPLLLPFVIGFALASLTLPAARLLSRRTPLPEKGARLVCVALFLLVLLLAVTFLVALLADGLAGLLREVPAKLSGLPEAMRQLYEKVIAAANRISPELALRLADTAAALTEEAGKPSEWIVGALGYLYNLLTGVPSFFLTVGVTVVSAFLFAADLPAVHTLLRRLPFVRGKESLTSEVFRSVEKLIFAYGKLMLLTFFELLLGFSLLRIRYAFTLALLIAVVDILPVLGVGTVLLPWSVVLFVLDNPTRGIALLALYGVITALRSVLEPKLIGKQLGLPAFVTLPCVFLGLRLGGLWGMFTLPVAVIVVLRIRQPSSKESDRPPSLQTKD